MDVLDRARALAATDVLGVLAAPALVALAERARVVELDAGANVTTRRDGGGVVLVVAAGALDAGGPGTLVGAAAALDGDAPARTATATAPAVVLELSHDDLIDVLAEHPAAAQALARELAQVLRRAST
ncbi:MAG TPA: hypothetical protein VM734_04710 [Kofleriaceae bacterium]|jgi:CRP-like cAMP-binding protein|nr:hypothetical protein [Kofleriaceae bacterium]